MPRATQLTLQVKNEIGALARLCRDLADRGVNVLGLSAPQTDGQAGRIHLLVANGDLAQAALGKAGYVFSVDEVLFIELKNRPGALARAVEKLASARIEVKYVFATAYGKAQKTAAVVAVNLEDLPRAVKLLG